MIFNRSKNIFAHFGKNIAHVPDRDNHGPLKLNELHYWEDPKFVIGHELNHIIDSFIEKTMIN